MSLQASEATCVIALAFAAARQNALRLTFISSFSVSVSVFSHHACGVSFIQAAMSVSTLPRLSSIFLILTGCLPFGGSFEGTAS